MSKTPKIDTIDLYDIVIDNCGKVPYENCFMMKKPHDVVIFTFSIFVKICEIFPSEMISNGHGSKAVSKDARARIHRLCFPPNTIIN